MGSVRQRGDWIDGGVAILWILGGYYHLRYYVRRRHEPETWKLQPKRMPSTKQQRRAMVLSTTNLAIGGAATGNLVYFVMTGALTTPVYFEVSEYGWIWTVASVPLLFFLVDGIAYYVHRFLHTRPMYKRFHKVHHRWRIGLPKAQFRLFSHQPLAFEPFPGLKFLPKNSRSTPESRIHAWIALQATPVDARVH